MKTNIRFFVAFACAAIVTSAPIVFAQSTDQTTLTSPTKATDIQQFLSDGLKGMVEIMLPIITLAYVYSGMLFAFARGNESRLSLAKRNFFYVTIGAILVLGAWVIATMIGGTVTQLTQ